MKKTTKKCAECGGEMVFESREDTVEYRGRKKSFKTKAWWCTSCDEAIFEGPALQAAERAFIKLRAEVDGVLLPEQVAKIREKLSISQRDAGRLLGGGPRAFQKYESGQVPVSVPMNNLLLLLGNDPDRLRELEVKIELPRRGKRVHVAKAAGKKAAGKKADKRRSGSEARK